MEGEGRKGGKTEGKRRGNWGGVRSEVGKS